MSSEWDEGNFEGSDLVIIYKKRILSSDIAILKVYYDFKKVLLPCALKRLFSQPLVDFVFKTLTNQTSKA